MPSRTRRPRAVPMDLRLPGLTVVLPCFDEEPNVAQAVREATSAACRCASAVEIVVVDDGSRDATGEIARELAEVDPRVRVVAHDVNRGYGAAVRSGITASRMPWVLLTDADLQFDLQQLDRLLPLAPDHDLVAGYRISRCDPLHRRAAAAAWNWLMRRTFGVPVRDVDCAFKLARGPMLRALDLTSEGAMVSMELYARATRDDWRIAEVGVHHRARLAGEASGGDPGVILRALRERRRLARELAGVPPGAGSPTGAGAGAPAAASGRSAAL
jgi:glycosyltransferase involved in cell wall biosynthesis